MALIGVNIGLPFDFSIIYNDYDPHHFKTWDSKHSSEFVGHLFKRCKGMYVQSVNLRGEAYHHLDEQKGMTIETCIKNSKKVVVILSPVFVEKKWHCYKKFLGEMSGKIIPVLLSINNKDPRFQEEVNLEGCLKFSSETYLSPRPEVQEEWGKLEQVT